MSRSSLKSFTTVAVLVAVLVALAAPITASAQFGSLKKKVKDKIAGDPQPASTGATPATGNAADADAKARQDAWQHPIAISSATLDAFVKGMKAENAERSKYLASASSTSAMGRWSAYQAEKAKCETDRSKADTAQLHLQQKMMAEATAGHAENIQKYTDSMTALGKAEQARQQKCSNLARPQFTQEDYTAVHAEEDKEEAAGAAASGLSPFAYARLKERVIAYALLPASWNPSGYTADEMSAINARKPELKQVIGHDFNTSGQRNPVGS
jgi:hypothetical protein